MIEVEITDAMVAAYQIAWRATPQGAPGDRIRAGLHAALARIPGQAAAITVGPDPAGVRAEGLHLAAIVCQPVGSGAGSNRMPAAKILDMAEEFSHWILTGERRP